MDGEKQMKAGDGLGSAIKGGSVSRRWLLRSTANITAGTLAFSSLSAAKAEQKHAAANESASTQHDPHASHMPTYNAAAFEGWESV